MLRSKVIISGLIILVSVYGQSNYLTDYNPDSLRFKMATAVRCSEAPIIDGDLDDDAWNSALPVDEFFQIDPLELAPPSEKTIAKVLYDDESLYISFRSYDSQPERIKRALVRRDNWMEGFNSNSDLVGFSIDSRNDDYNCYFFAVNASGVKIDVSISGHEEYDSSWDAVWDVAIQIKPDGWTAEFGLPFAMFQFDNMQDLVWGIEFLRGFHHLAL